ncbi:MAG: amidohydrolase family protein [Candidatus Marinimicrobia bacterium]|nr:amidohydrolase family protein [Candidatus Neomarinimicrobiota bacterium]
MTNNTRQEAQHFILINGVITDGLSFVLENGALEIRSGKIVRIGTSADFSGEKTKKIDLGGRLVLPGLVNPHHHLYSALATGLAPTGPTGDFQQILENLWWHLDKSLDEESIYYSAMQGLMQSVRYGVTTVVDHHASMSAVGGSLNIIKKAYETVGIKGLLCYEISDRMGEAALQSQIDENIKFWTDTRDNDRIQGLLGLHANFTLGEKSMEKIAKQKPTDLPVHIHCGEDAADLRYCRDLGYEGPVHRLKAFGLLSKDSLLAHCIHLSEADHRLLKESRAWVISNPESNANNRVGVMDLNKIPKYLLGTDGMTGNILGTMRSHFLLRNGKVDHAPEILFAYPAEMLRRCFPESGTLREGGSADLAVCNYRPVTPVSPENLFYHLMFGVQGKEMFMTLAEGKILFSENTFHTLDEVRINREIRSAVKRLYGRYHA